ncbi:MAG: hypothetical protein ACRDN6_02740 [Gaiellaceae bacterium]
MTERGRVESFLRSGAGMVTAAATFVAAIAGLVTALSQLRGGDSAPGVETRSATTLALEDASERELRSRIPDSIWPTCSRPTDPEPNAAAAVNCTYRRLVELQYNLFTTSGELQAAYSDVKQRYGLAGAATGDSCVAGRFEGDFKVDGRVAGSLLCFVDEAGHVAAVVWTHDDLDILSFAWRNDMNLPALYETWQEGVGPND